LITLRVGCVGSFASRDAVPDRDLFWSDEDVLDQEAQNPLPLDNVGGARNVLPRRLRRRTAISSGLRRGRIPCLGQEQPPLARGRPPTRREGRDRRRESCGVGHRDLCRGQADRLVSARSFLRGRRPMRRGLSAQRQQPAREEGRLHGLHVTRVARIGSLLPHPPRWRHRTTGARVSSVRAG
jgi:hypothetical protein